MRNLQIGEGLTRDAVQVLTSMLGQNALPSLENLGLGHVQIKSGDLANLLHGLEQSVCARRLRGLRFSICAEGVKVLGIAIGRDSFPSLENLDLGRNR